MRYFFDLDDGDHHFQDNEGSELSDAKEARDEAIGLLPELAMDRLPDGDRHTFVSTVRAEDGSAIFRATLTLATEWLDRPDRQPAKR